MTALNMNREAFFMVSEAPAGGLDRPQEIAEKVG
jgi:hypothetical protein